MTPLSEITNRLDEIESRANAATKGPWRESEMSSIRVCFGEKFKGGVVAYTGEHCGTLIPTMEAYANNTFIASAREDVPVLVKVAREAAAYIKTSLCHPNCRSRIFSTGPRLNCDCGREAALSSIVKLLKSK